MGEIAGVSMASLGRYLHSSKTRARRAEGFHNELNGQVFDLEKDGLGQVVPCLLPYDKNKQPYHTKSYVVQQRPSRLTGR